MRDVLLGAVSAIALVVGLSAVTAPEARRDVLPRIVPDNGGAFRELAIHFDPRAEALAGPAYRDLLRALDPSVAVWVAVKDEADFDRFLELVAAWGVQHPGRFQPAVTGRRITTWSRDRYTLLERGNERVLMVPPRPNEGNEARENDWTAPFAIAMAHGGVHVEVAPLVFDGGDLVATEDTVFATALLRGRNLEGTLGSPALLSSWLAAFTGREPVILGTEPEDVPGHHIGMFVTPIGGRVVLVGDPDLGLSLLPDDARLPLEADRSEETLETFRLVARELEERGFDVRRIPLVPLSDGLTYISYNNVLLEHRSDGLLHAYVPQLGVPALDRAGLDAYRAIGAVVHPIDASAIYAWNGTVRCLVNVLARD